MRSSAFVNFKIISSFIRSQGIYFSTKCSNNSIQTIFIILIIIVNPVTDPEKLKVVYLSRIIKFILILVFLVVFFEAGLISSYTIVTSQAPDVGKLIGMQIEEITSLISFGSGSNIINTQQNKVISNPDDVAAALQNKTGLSGINVQSLTAQTIANSKKTIIPVNITVMGYQDSISGGNSTQIIISANQTYSITATANGTLSNGKIDIDVNTIQITSSRKLYGNTNGT